MQYLGGKSRIAAQIANIIELIRQKDQLYIEPFIGSCSVFHLVDNPKEGYDNSEDLILLWQAIQNGWIPPVNLTEEEYGNLKSSKPSALRAFAGFGCSFGGKFFGGYARQPETGYNFAQGTCNSLMRKRQGILNATIELKDYRELNPTDAIIYCDPPYANTTQQYGNKDVFNSKEFWSIVREWSSENTVIVSEFDAPEDFGVLAELNPYKSMRNHRTEKILMSRIYLEAFRGLLNQQDSAFD